MNKHIETALIGARKVRSLIEGRWKRFANRGRFEREFLAALPASLAPAARWAFDPEWSEEERQLVGEVEAFRGKIGEVAGGAAIESLPSPHSGTFAVDARGHARPGERRLSPVATHAKTGVKSHGGILLRRIVTGLGSKQILELGTNTGFSACYFVSAPQRPRLVTIEGSSALCEVARRNIARFSQDFSVVNALFDDAIDELTASGARFDCVFIDGQHEKKATLHYAERTRALLAPGGALIFDDIYWSTDMNEAWREACRSDAYGLTVDLGKKGIVLVADRAPKRHLDLSALTARPVIGRPSW